MEDGLVREYDSVPNLMGRTQSTFRRMVEEAGLEVPAASVSRAASAASLAAAAAAAGVVAGAGGEEEGEEEGEEAPRQREGLQTFVRRMQNDYRLD